MFMGIDSKQILQEFAKIEAWRELGNIQLAGTCRGALSCPGIRHGIRTPQNSPQRPYRVRGCPVGRVAGLDPFLPSVAWNARPFAGVFHKIL